MGLVVAVAVALMVGTTTAGRAATPGPPIIENAEAQQISSTRAVIFAFLQSESGIHYHFEYSTNENGPWTQTEVQSEEAPNPRNPTDTLRPSTELHHLSPSTAYYARVLIENESGVAIKSFKFTTAAISAPTIGDLLLDQKEVNAGAATLGTTYGDFQAEVESDGAETEYQFEYAEEQALETRGEAAWAPASGTGTTGTVTVAEDFDEAEVHVTGLKPGTAYRLRLKASNEKGVVTEDSSFTTNPLSPQVVTGNSGISDVAASSATMKGAILTRSFETHWRFEYATSEAGPWNIGPAGTISSSEASENSSSVSGELTGLSPATAYFVRVFAENGHEPSLTSAPWRFETSGPPVAVTFEAHTFVPGGETVRVLGSVEPHGYDTHYHFEYVSGEKFAASEWREAESSTEGDAGQGEFNGEAFPARIVGADLPGLRAGGTYHVRLVASSAQGTVEGADQTLTVPIPAAGEESSCANASLRDGSSAHLPDCRAYEQVTPANKEGSEDNWFFSGVLHTPSLVGEDGNHVLVRPQFSKWGSNADATNASYLFSRASDGWQMTSFTSQPAAGDDSYRPILFSPDLTQSALTVGWSTGLVNASPELEYEAGPPGGPYTTLASIPRPLMQGYNDGWVGASADFSKVILKSEDRHVCGHTDTTSGSDLYEFSRGQCRQVNVGIGVCGALMPSFGNGGASGGDVSEDGSRVFFEAVPGNNCSEPSHLYMRVNGDETIDIGAYEFRAANARGSDVLLEKRSGETYEVFLYESESNKFEPLLSGHQGFQASLDASEDLSVFYFLSKEQLTPEAPAPFKESEDVGADPENIYRYDLTGKKLSFIEQTSGENGSGYVSPDGRYFYWSSAGVAAVFREVSPLLSGEEEQLYRYDSVEKIVECMSCASSFNPKPKQSSIFPTAETVKYIEQPPNSMPGTTVASANGDYVFFDTAAALVPQDVDGEVSPCSNNACEELDEDGNHDESYSVSSDVYEWRKNGIDGCSHVQGCVALISSGTGGLGNVFLGTTRTGEDVFFATHSQLVSQDDDNQGDIYDARVSGGFPPLPPGPVECEGDACLSPVGAPIDTTPASVSFSGPGNPAAPAVAPKAKAKVKVKAKGCAKGAVRVKGKCLKRRRAKRSRRAVGSVKRNDGGHK
jgi:hypothetical protein